MSLPAISSFFSSQQIGGVSTTHGQKNANDKDAGATMDRFGPAFEVNLSPQAQDMLNSGGTVGSGVVQGLMVNGLTQSNTGNVNYGATYKAGLFAIADANHDGTVTQDELIQQATAGGASKSEAEAMFAVNDENHDGEVTSKEFSETMATPVKNNTLGGQMFQMLDSNGDGTVTKAEIENLLEKAGKSKEEISAVTDKLGLNSTDKISLNDFTGRLTDAKSNETDFV